MICKTCKNKFIQRNGNQRYCSKKCSQIGYERSQKEYKARQIKKTKDNMKDISDKSNKALKLGISYGLLVQQEYLKKKGFLK